LSGRGAAIAAATAAKAATALAASASVAMRAGSECSACPRSSGRSRDDGRLPVRLGGLQIRRRRLFCCRSQGRIHSCNRTSRSADFGFFR
jgi:hypothetical protein